MVMESNAPWYKVEARMALGCGMKVTKPPGVRGGPAVE